MSQRTPIARQGYQSAVLASPQLSSPEKLSPPGCVKSKQTSADPTLNAHEVSLTRDGSTHDSSLSGLKSLNVLKYDQEFEGRYQQRWQNAPIFYWFAVFVLGTGVVLWVGRPRERRVEGVEG